MDPKPGDIAILARYFLKTTVPMIVLSNMVVTCDLWLSQLQSKFIRIK